MSATYNPGVDSTPKYAAKATETNRLYLDQTGETCLCGCGEATPGRFRPGHDARLKGRLLRAHLNRVHVVVVRDGKEKEQTARAVAKDVSSDTHDWTGALDRAAEKAKDAAARLRIKAESDKVQVAERASA